MGLLKRGDGGQHRGGLGLVALERLDHQREPGRIGEQPDGDLRLEAGFTLLVTDAEDTLSWERAEHAGWWVGMYAPGDEHDGLRLVK